MLHEHGGLLCEFVGVPSKFLERLSQRLERRRAGVREPCSLRPTRRVFRTTPGPLGGTPYPLSTMLCVFVGHPPADSATPSSFSERRDVLANEGGVPVRERRHV
jgi:hypothetical protein